LAADGAEHDRPSGGAAKQNGAAAALGGAPAFDERAGYQHVGVLAFFLRSAGSAVRSYVPVGREPEKVTNRHMCGRQDKRRWGGAEASTKRARNLDRMLAWRERRLKVGESHQGAVRRELAAIHLGSHAWLARVARKP
jgi:hypothetical protein